jgi:hypothetical protein
MKRIIICLIVAAGLAGCAGVTTSVPSTSVVQVSGDIYEIMDVDYRGIFGSEASLKERNVKQAVAFASERNKVAVPILARIHRVGIMGDWAWFYYKFSLAAPDSPEAIRKFADITVERDARLSEEFYRSRQKEGAVIAYDDLLKLEDLRKSGVITESEFQQQKTKILNK